MTTAAEIREAIELSYPPDQYLVLHECAQSPARQGRKIDSLVVSLWESRKLELDAIEIKVSVSDWMREVNAPEKSAWWVEHSHRFWVACPLRIATKVNELLPAGWGLLVPTDAGRIHVAKKAVRRDATPLPWRSVVGIMRGASGAGVNALFRAEQKGYREGVARGKALAEAAASGERV